MIIINYFPFLQALRKKTLISPEKTHFSRFPPKKKKYTENIKNPPTEIQIRKVVLKYLIGFQDFILLYGSPEDRRSFDNNILMPYHKKYTDAFDKRISAYQDETYNDFYLEICWIVRNYKLSKEVFHKELVAVFESKGRKVNYTDYLVRADILQDFLVDFCACDRTCHKNGFILDFIRNYKEYMYVKDHDYLLKNYWEVNPDVKAKYYQMYNILYILDEILTEK